MLWAAIGPAWQAQGAGPFRAAAHQVRVDEPEPWRRVLAPLGLEAVTHPAPVRIVVGGSAAARAHGFLPRDETLRAAVFEETRAPALEIYWQEPQLIPRFDLPPGAVVYQREKHSGAPVLAALDHDRGAVVWCVLPPGEAGYERYPYLLQALVALGAKPPFRTNRLWAFLDYAYRLRVDPEYFAPRWRRAGLGALHVSAWHFFEPDSGRDDFLRRLIRACHREGVLVYAWLELPHVSEAFWRGHPRCREKTAVLEDAHLDWRKLVNLNDPDCSERVRQGVAALLERFDWDGINFAELYFESLHGPGNPSRFTPMNGWVRQDAEQRLGFDPLKLFDPASRYHWAGNPDAWRRFAAYRRELALQLQHGWLAFIRKIAPGLDLVVTQIDDRLDERMRDYLGADAASLLPLAEEIGFRLIIEDPATLWDRGPERYTEIARRYRPLAGPGARLGIDINIVERYQQTYPTRKQTGAELLQLAAAATEAFDRVLLYFEHSLGRLDLALLPRIAGGNWIEAGDGQTVVRCPRPCGVAWEGPAEVNGAPWPVFDGRGVWLPAGRHRLRPAAPRSGPRALALNAELLSAAYAREGFTLRYRSDARAIALLSENPTQIVVDGREITSKALAAEDHWALPLPPGAHEVRFRFSGLLR